MFATYVTIFLGVPMFATHVSIFIVVPIFTTYVSIFLTALDTKVAHMGTPGIIHT